MEILVDWGGLGLALICFLLAHMLPARPPVRAAIVAIFGRKSYIIAYSFLSIGLLMWVARAAGSAPYVELWPYDDRLVVVPVLGMALACLLLVFGLSSPNPLSLGRAAGYDAAAPGVVAIVRHPVLWAALIWAGGHAAVNGDLAHLIVFGTFAVLAVAGMLALDRRFKRRVGAVEWHRLARHTSNVPFVGLLRGARLHAGNGTLLRACGSVALYPGLVLSHELFAGVPVPL